MHCDQKFTFLISKFSKLTLYSIVNSSLFWSHTQISNIPAIGLKKIIHTQGAFKGFLTEDQPKIKLKAKMIVVKMFNFIPGLSENIPMKKSLP